MSAYSSLLNIDLSLPAKLASYVASAISEDSKTRKSHEETLLALVESKSTHDLTNKIFENIDGILEASSEEEVESFIQATVSVMYTLSEDVDALATIGCIVAGLSNNLSQPKLRLKGLVTLLNLVIETDAKFNILSAIFKFALSTSQSKYISHFHSRIDEWIVNWELSISEKRFLYHTMSEILSHDGQTSTALSYLIKYFKTYSGQKYPADVEEFAIKAVVSAIKSPVASFGDRSALLESFGDQAVVGDLQKLVALLKVVCTGKLYDFTAMDQDFLIKYSIDRDHVLYSMRLMTLCSLGCDKNILSFKEIAATLDIDEDNVEEWVVDAVGQDLMDAHIDQLTQSVSVSRSAHRSFGAEQWVSVQEKLRNLRKKVASVLEAVRKHT